jgi:restriction system protein
MAYYLDIEHKGLGKFRRIRGSDEFVVGRKAQEQELAWQAQWERKKQIETAQERRIKAAYDKTAKKKLAETQTDEAQAEIDSLRCILTKSMSLCVW